jgi:mRNA deadenylase 3'-5' endonuclease subunit Ccr4
MPGHSLLMQSTYAAHEEAAEAPFTVCTESATATGDYIWHSNLLATASTVEMVDKAALQAEGGLPSVDYSSQHVPLVATFTESSVKPKLSVARSPLPGVSTPGPGDVGHAASPVAFNMP